MMTDLAARTLIWTSSRGDHGQIPRFFYRAKLGEPCGGSPDQASRLLSTSCIWATIPTAHLPACEFFGRSLPRRGTSPVHAGEVAMHCRWACCLLGPEDLGDRRSSYNQPKGHPLCCLAGSGVR